MPGSPWALLTPQVVRTLLSYLISTFLLGWRCPDLKAGVQLSQHTSIKENTLGSAPWWLSPGGVTEEKGWVKGQWLWASEALRLSRRKGWEAAGLFVCCASAKEGVEKKLKYGCRERLLALCTMQWSAQRVGSEAGSPLDGERERLYLAARTKANYSRNLSFKVVSIFPKEHLFENQFISGFCLFVNTLKGNLKITSYFVFHQDGLLFTSPALVLTA